MTTPQILYIRLDENYEPDFASSKPGLITDINAVSQAILTRLRLLQGEWWENQIDGLPLWQQILGKGTGHNQEKVNLLIQERILGTPYVTDVFGLQSSYNADTRAFNFSCGVETQFGQVSVTQGFPMPPAQGV